MPDPRPYDTRIAIPDSDSINTKCSPCGTANMVRRLGIPGLPTRNCSTVRNKKIARLTVTQDVGPFRVSGLRPAVESLARIFKLVQEDDPKLYREIKTAGMSCNRLIRGSAATYSIHSWGCAIDLFCGADIVPLGVPRTHLGVRLLYPYFANEGWYWGAAFRRADAMHMECSKELVDRWAREGKL